MQRRAIKTDRAPAAIGPYSQAVRCGNLVFVSGQLGLDPATGQLAETVEGQVRQALANLRAILEEAGASLDSVVKTTLFLRSMDDFALVNRVYAEFFSEPAPARSTVEVAALPRGAAFEVEAIAVVSD
ncbi:MAG TPA: RidA family protein [Limnochordales bacterium]